MGAKEYSILIEKLLRRINPSMEGKSSEILLDPYGEIVSAVEYRVPVEKLEKFVLYYQGISGKSLQKLIDESYDVGQLLKDLRQVVEGN